MSDPGVGAPGEHAYSGDGWRVDTDDLVSDAHVWEGWASRLGEIDKSLDLKVTADNFSFLPGAQDVYVATTKALAALHAYSHAGTEDFEQIAKKLLQTSILYLKSQTDTQEDIEAVQAEVDELP